MQPPLEQQVETADRSSLATREVDGGHPLHWMPVSAPGLTHSEQRALMQHVDQAAYVLPGWLRADSPVKGSQDITLPGKDASRDPMNPSHWIPLPPPSVAG